MKINELDPKLKDKKKNKKVKLKEQEIQQRQSQKLMIENKMVNNKTKMLFCNKILHKKISRKSAHQRER